VGGLADIKATRIQSILSTLAEEQGGQCSLEHLRALPPAEVKEQLGRFKGVGKKTVACVLLFALEVSSCAV
jgi:endonuclease-3